MSEPAVAEVKLAVAEVVDTKTGEVVSLAIRSANSIEALVKDADKPIFKAMEGMDTLDWKHLKPNQMAVLLMQRPMAVSGGGVLYLNFRQALYFAVRAFELGVSPFSSAVWFDPQKFTVNLNGLGGNTSGGSEIFYIQLYVRSRLNGGAWGAWEVIGQDFYMNKVAGATQPFDLTRNVTLALTGYNDVQFSAGFSKGTGGTVAVNGAQITVTALN